MVPRNEYREACIRLGGGKEEFPTSGVQDLLCRSAVTVLLISTYMRVNSNGSRPKMANESRSEFLIGILEARIIVSGGGKVEEWGKLMNYRNKLLVDVEQRDDEAWGVFSDRGHIP